LKQIFDKQQFVIIAVGLALVAGLGAARFFPILRKFETVKEARGEYVTERQELARLADQVQVLSAKLGTLKGEIGDLDSKIPAEPTFADLCERLAAVMKECKLGGQLIQPGKELEGQEVNGIPISIQCKGDVYRVFEFLKALEKFERVIRIENLELTEDMQASGPLLLKADAVVFYRRGESQTQGGG